MKEFNIGDKVMVNFGRLRKVDWVIDEIIGETKTLWRCKEFSFSKDRPYRVRGYPNSMYYYSEAIPFDEEKYNRFLEKKKFTEDVKQAFDTFYSTALTVEQKISFIEWVEKNLQK